MEVCFRCVTAVCATVSSPLHQPLMRPGATVGVESISTWTSEWAGAGSTPNDHIPTLRPSPGLSDHHYSCHHGDIHTHALMTCLITFMIDSHLCKICRGFLCFVFTIHHCCNKDISSMLYTVYNTNYIQLTT